MPDGSVPLLIAIVVLILLSGFFSATETAFSCVNKIKLRSLAANGNKRAGKVLDLTENKYNSLIATILVGNNIVNLTVSSLSTIFFAMILINGTTIDPTLLSTIVITLVVLFFGEITPKFIANVYPEKMAMLFYPLIMLFYYLFYPFNVVMNGWKWLIAKIFRLKKEDVVTEDEIMTIVEEAEEDGTLREEETKLIRSVIEFDDLEVGDIIVPRVNVVAVEVGSSMDKIKDVFDSEGYSRIPVYKDGIDTIIGTIHEKDFFIAYLDGKKDINGILQNAFYTTEHVKISALLKQMQKNRVHLAIVLDEYGGTLGIVTVEDIIEELVGEIYDEYDEETKPIKDLGNLEYLINCSCELSLFFEEFNLYDDDDEFDANTVSGWVTEQLGELPMAGRKFSYKHLDVEVTKSTMKKVVEIKVKVNEITDEE